MNIYEKLTEVQNELKAPKSRYNSFGKYNYRSCEDILEAVKPLLKSKKLAMTVKDEVYSVDGRFYIMAVVTVFDCESEEKITTTAYAREDSEKKGMDGSQITGSSSSYARKYALNGMFAIDDTKDADSWNTHGKDKSSEKKEEQKEQKVDYATDEQIGKINCMCNANPEFKEALTNALKKYGVNNVVQLTKEQAEELIERLKNPKR